MNGTMERGHLTPSKVRRNLICVFWLFTFLWHQHGYAGQDKVVISVSEAVMRSAPGFLSKAIAKVPYGTPVRILGRDSGWVNIVADKKTGWVQRSALQEAEYVLKDLGRGEKASVDTYKNDVVTAGKGFSPEFESMMKSNGENLNYAAVDEMERFGFKELALFKFARRGRIASDLLE
jgi:uncharacterized protein YgiM (DUF1202 family)